MDSNQSALIDTIIPKLAHLRRWKYVELRGGNIFPQGAKPFQIYHSHSLDLDQDTAEIYQKMEPSVRRAIRKSESSDLQITVERDLKAIEKFYDLHGRTRRRHGLPPQPISFFRAIGRHLIEKDFGFVVLARLGHVPVAGAVFLHSEKRAIYKFGASDVEYWPHRPNQGVMWGGIQELAKIGCAELQFGRTSQADRGLTKFKLSWGAVAQPLAYYRYVPSVDDWTCAERLPTESHPLVFGHLPIACNRLAGQLIYPHLD